MIRHIWEYVQSLWSPRHVRLAIVRRYEDANGNYIGELYLDQTVTRKHDTLAGYVMIGASLDSMPLDSKRVQVLHDWRGSYLPMPNDAVRLDLQNDFLQPMTADTLRVGALDPADNDDVRRLIAALPRKNMTLVIQNGFIERPQGVSHA